MPSLTGLAIGRYQVKERLGGGGMGEVYRAWDTLLEKWVALKRPTPGVAEDSEARRRLLREARAASALEHPAIAVIYDFLDFEGEPFIVQEFVRGASLRKRLGTPFDPQTFLSIAIDCAEGLVAAAAKGIVHCDLKPENILLTDEGRPKILDFGIARRRLMDQSESAMTIQATATMTMSVGLTGTPSYIAPEVIMGSAPDARADIFAMGVVFYEMLTGRNPFHRESMSATLVSVARDEPELPSAVNEQVPGDLDAVILKMLAKEPAQRYATAADLLADLQRIRDGARPTVRIPITRRRRRIRILISVTFALSVIAVVVIVGGRGKVDGPAAAGRYLAIEQFKNFGEDPKFEFFAVGLTESVQARLAGLKGIYVVEARSDVGTKLTLEGGVQRSSDQIRITYRLMDKEKGVSVGGGGVDGDVSNLFKLQDEVVEKICQTLSTAYGLEPVEAQTERPTRDARAYDLYLQARGYLHNYEDEKNVEVAVELFQKALERDPQFPLALAGLGEAYWKRYEATHDPVWVDKAEEVSQKAFQFGRDLAAPHVTLGTIYNGTGKFDSAALEFGRAIQLDPKADDGYRGLAKAQEGLGRLDAAEHAFVQAIAARPDYWGSHKDLGVFYYRHGQLDKALSSFLKVVELSPKNAWGYSNLGAVYQAMGRAPDAIKAYEKSLSLQPNLRAHSNLAALYKSQGRFREAAEHYEAAIKLDDRDYRVWGSLGGVYRHLEGRKASADSALDRAITLAERQRQINPNDARLLVALSQYYADNGSRKEAETLLERALALAPEQVDVLFHASLAFELLKNRARSLEMAGRAISAGFPVENFEKDPELADLVADPQFKKLANDARSRDSTKAGSDST